MTKEFFSESIMEFLTAFNENGRRSQKTVHFKQKYPKNFLFQLLEYNFRFILKRSLSNKLSVLIA